jgi:hypothetical protein
MYTFYSHNLKCHLEICKLAEFLGLKTLKILRNVKTWWVSMLSPTIFYNREHEHCGEYVWRPGNKHNCKCQFGYVVWCWNLFGFGLHNLVVRMCSEFVQIWSYSRCLHMWFCECCEGMWSWFIPNVIWSSHSIFIQGLQDISFHCWSLQWNLKHDLGY